MTTPPALRLHVDGASRGNPGEAGFGVHVTAPDGSEVASLYGYLGKATNNVAEYQALLHGLRFALARGASRVEVFSDSELLVRQIEGRYRVKNAGLQPLHGEAKVLLARFERARVCHVPRERNTQADALANRAALIRRELQEARDAFEMGHMDHQVRAAVAAGLDPIRAVQMATLNAAELHRVDHLVGSITRPVKELKGFSKEFLKAGETRTITFTITPEDLKFYNYDLVYDWEPGEFDIMLGGNSRDIQAARVIWEK